MNFKYKWDVTAFATPVTYNGPLEPRAGHSCATLAGALFRAYRYLNGFYVTKYEYVEIGRHKAA